MKTTTNLGLKKIELTDSPPDITVQDPNWDTIDKHLFTAVNFQKAGGTGTAITLNEVTLNDGYSKTFIASAANSGAATTINSKKLFKAGGTSAPNLIAGKAYTVWYDSTGDSGNGCFFIKASAEGDAVAANVLAGKKFSNDNDTGIAGTMTNNGATTITPGASDIAISAGYHNGSGKVVGDTDLVGTNIKAGITIFGVAGNANVVDTAEATNPIAAASILSGKIGFVNGVKVTGSIPSKSAATITPGTTDQTIAANQYLSGVQTISGDADLVAGNIKAGVSIFGVAGNANVIDTSAGDATAAQILSGKKAAVDGVMLTGTLPNKDTSANWMADDRYTTGNGRLMLRPQAGAYSPGGWSTDPGNIGGWVYVDDADYVASNIRNGVDIFGLVGTAKAVVSGTVFPYTSATQFTQGNFASAIQLPAISVSGLSGMPSAIIAWCLYNAKMYMVAWAPNSQVPGRECIIFDNTSGIGIAANLNTSEYSATSSAYVNATGFCLPVFISYASSTWVAIYL